MALTQENKITASDFIALKNKIKAEAACLPAPWLCAAYRYAQLRAVQCGKLCTAGQRLCLFL